MIRDSSIKCKKILIMSLFISVSCQHCRVGVALDAYLMPVEDGIETTVEQPLLFINSWTFQWPENMAKIKSLIDTSAQCDSESVCIV